MWQSVLTSLAIANYNLLADWQSKVEGLLSGYWQFLYKQDVKRFEEYSKQQVASQRE